MATYYTPTVEDLVWGLEYDIKGKGDLWHKYIIDTRTKSSDFVFATNYLLQSLRVKHLDEDDILELGWNKRTFTNEYDIEVNDTVFFLVIEPNKSISIATTSNLNLIHLYPCRNKAELKRLMNNLSITK